MNTKHNLKPVERSFYAPILEFLKDIGFQGVSEIGIVSESNYMDILLKYGNLQYIVEVKISDKTEDILEGIVQVDKYSRKYGTNNKIVICYPNDVRTVSTIKEINKIAIDRSCRIISLTDEYHKIIDNITVEEYFSTLQSLIDHKHSSILRIETASKILEDSILLLSRLINKEFNDDDLFNEMLDYLTKDQGLFLSLCNLKTKSRKILRNQVIDLLAYILINQILFYFVYSKNTNRGLDELKPVDKIQDLHTYFNQIKKIDFKPIYDIDVVSRIPSHYDILCCINNIIGCMSPLKVDDLRYDLFGRLIGKSMPNETRDVLASYYTKTNSSEFLSKLLIDKWDEKVCDLACGSGTLLVASYNRKKELYEQIKGELSKGDGKTLHKMFIQEQITGMDIMPFACHLTGLNLSAQNLHTETDFVRVSNKNSLEIDIDKECEVAEAYGDMSNSLEKIQRKQREIYDFMPDSPNPVSFTNPETSSKTFKLERANTIIINPPFTSYNKIPEKFKNEFFRPRLTEIVGKKVGLWACFLVIADEVLVDGGKMGAIIHTSFLRGKSSQLIRDCLLDNYTIEYLIKPSDNSSFSEDTAITDIMLIAKKTKPDKNHETNIILLKKPIDSYSISDIDVNLVNDIETVTDERKENDHFIFIKIKQTELKENRNNIARFMFGRSLKNIDLINTIYKKIGDGGRAKMIDVDQIQAGVQFRPKGESKKRLITRKYAPSRIQKAELYFKNGVKNGILEYFDKEGNVHSIEESKLRKTMRTLVGIDKLDASELYDYLILNDNYTKAKSKVIFAHKMRLNSDNTFLTSVYFEDEITPTNALSMYFTDDDEIAKVLTMFFSSILYLIQFKIYDKKTTVGVLEIGEQDMKEMYIPDIKNIPRKQIDDVLSYFEEFKHKNFPCLKTQLKERVPKRVELDKHFLKILNIKLSNNELYELYDVFLDEI
jgi:hypothetical protein